MEVGLRAVADSANLSQEGKLNILGIFDTIGAASFPVRHPSMAFAFQLRAEYDDQNKNFDLDVSLIDADNHVIWGARAHVAVGAIAAGVFQHQNQVIILQEVLFNKAGRYRFRVRIGEVVSDAVFQVVQR